MIPLRDKNPTQRFPFVTIFLVAANITMFIYELTLGPNLELFLVHYGVMPATISIVLHGFSTNPLVLLTLVTFLFLQK